MKGPKCGAYIMNFSLACTNFVWAAARGVYTNTLHTPASPAVLPMFCIYGGWVHVKNISHFAFIQPPQIACLHQLCLGCCTGGASLCMGKHVIKPQRNVLEQSVKVFASEGVACAIFILIFTTCILNSLTSSYGSNRT